MRLSSKILAACLLTVPAIAEAQQDQAETGVTYTAESGCLKRLSEAVPGFETRLSEADRRDLRELLRPALVLARRGNEVACQAILTEIERIGAAAQGQALTAEQRTQQIARARQVGPDEVLRVQDLLDADVVTPEGEELGDIEDFLIVPGSEAPVYALVDRDGGWFSAGSDLVLVPLTRMRMTEAGELVTGATAAQFEEAPVVEGRGVPRAEAAVEADRYWAEIGP